MRKKVPAIILALGISAAPVFAKNSNRRTDSKDLARVEENKKIQKRQQKSYLRQKKMELEKEFIRETEMEINNVLLSSSSDFDNRQEKTLHNKTFMEVVVKDDLPANGIDISEQFKQINKSGL